MSKKILFFLMITALFLACKQDNENDELPEIPEKIDTAAIFNDIKTIYYSLPSPIEISNLIKKYANNFNPDDLNSVKNLANYTTSTSEALNTGIYSADLAFLLSYDQNQNTNEYFAAIIKLAQNLGITEGLNDTLINDVRDNIDKPEKVKQLIGEAFFKSDAFLKENDYVNIAALITIGAWTESVYLLDKMAAAADYPDALTQLLIDQRLVLENILKIAQQTSVDNSVIRQLSDLQDDLNNCVTVTKKQMKDPYTDSLLTKTIVEYDYNADKLSILSKKIGLIRKNFVSLQ